MQDNTIREDERPAEELPLGSTLLHGQYVIEGHLIAGGFGMTYLARDSLHRRVVIKECFPSAFCDRIRGQVRPSRTAHEEHYQIILRNFLREALRLAKLEHPNIVGVHQVFQENNTAYFAMDFIDGMDLLTILEDNPSRLTNELLRKLLCDTLNALDHVHSFGMLHRDISPDNLLLDSADHLTMIDFGAARENIRRQSRALSKMIAVKDGYSPHEFYDVEEMQEPCGDLYSVGATFYHLITGAPPPNGQQRLTKMRADGTDSYVPLAGGGWRFDEDMLASIDRSLAMSPQLRFQSSTDWLAVLEQPVRSGSVKPAGNSAHTETEAGSEEIDPGFAQTISSLVEDTNSVIALAPADDPEPDLDTPLEAEPDNNQLVDMFGNPIEDVEAWMREQDRRRGRRDTANDDNEQAAEAGQPANRVQRRFGLSRVLDTLVNRHRHRPTSPSQT